MAHPEDSRRRRVARWLETFAPAPASVSAREVVLGCVGALVGLLCAAKLGHLLLAGFDPWFIAPMGASAVLLFAVPSSPLAQPWSVVGGNVVAALIGVTCAAHIADIAVAGSVAVAAAIGAMFGLRCLHPPSGAVALTAVLGGPAIHALGYRFVLWPVAIDSLLLLMTALLFNVSARRRYPHRASSDAARRLPDNGTARARLEVTVQDLDAALRARGELLDVSRDDLEELFLHAEGLARARHGAAAGQA